MNASLYDLTGFESGVVIHGDSVAIICNWTQVDGIPRIAPGGLGVIGLGEELPEDMQPEEMPAQAVHEAFSGGRWEIGYAVDPESVLSDIAESAQSGETCQVYTLADDVKVITFAGWN